MQEKVGKPAPQDEGGEGGLGQQRTPMDPAELLAWWTVTFSRAAEMISKLLFQGRKENRNETRRLGDGEVPLGAASKVVLLE